MDLKGLLVQTQHTQNPCDSAVLWTYERMMEKTAIYCKEVEIDGIGGWWMTQMAWSGILMSLDFTN